MAGPTVEVHQRFYPIDDVSQYAIEPLDCLVWRQDEGGRVSCPVVDVPQGYVPGLLHGSINGRSATMAQVGSALGIPLDLVVSICRRAESGGE